MTAEQIIAEVTVRYGGQVVTDAVAVPIDTGQPWMDLGAGVVALTTSARAALWDLVDRDRQALAGAEERGGGAGGREAPDAGDGRDAPPSVLARGESR